MDDIGSYIEVDFLNNGGLFERYNPHDILCLNNCRSAIYHAARCYGVSKIWIAKYQCDVVKKFLLKKGLEVLEYNIDENFNPILESNSEDSCIVLTNYFGIFGKKHFDPLVRKYKKVIIDNALALYCSPRDDAINCYSPRKFVAAPDGAYVIGKNVNKFKYPQDLSSITSQFLLMRSEFGCNGDGYKNKKINDERIDSSDIMLMSNLTKKMLNSIDYKKHIEKRKENFAYARELFDKINLLNISELIDDDCTPMGYPLLINFDVIPEFHKNHIYQARYWEWLINDNNKASLEYKYARYIALICTDQRYGKKEIDYQWQIVQSIINKK